MPDNLAYFYSSTVNKGAFLQGNLICCISDFISNLNIILIGYGRHTKEEVYEIGKKDLNAINDLIGNHKFLLSDKVCDADACIFGMLCQYMFHFKGPLNDHIQSK